MFSEMFYMIIHHAHVFPSHNLPLSLSLSKYISLFDIQSRDHITFRVCVFWPASSTSHKIRGGGAGAGAGCFVALVVNSLIRQIYPVHRHIHTHELCIQAFYAP